MSHLTTPETLHCRIQELEAEVAKLTAALDELIQFTEINLEPGWIADAYNPGGDEMAEAMPELAEYLRQRETKEEK